MILLEIKKHFKQIIDASVFDIAKAFNIQSSAAQGMIDFWVTKGQLVACEKKCAKSSCSGCPVSLPRYRLINKES